MVTAAIGPGANSDNAHSVAIQPDGKMIVAGQSNGLTGSQADFSAARFNADGSLDLSFSGDGKTNIDVSASGTIDLAMGVAILPDGRIAMAGYAVMADTSYDQAAVMLAADGSLDASFGGGGHVTIDIGNDSAEGNGAVVQPDGKTVVVGHASSSSRGLNFALQRFNVDGTVDNSFGTGGKVITPIGPGTFTDQAFAVALQPDGKIVVAGSAAMGTTGTDFALARYNPDGTLDTTFDGDGIVTTAIGPNSTDTAAAVTIQPDGKILAAGHAAMGASGDDYAVVRYNANGSLDTAFSGDGVATTTIAGGTGVDRARAIALQADGKIVAAGFSNMGSPTGQDFSLVRYNADGSLDLSFDGDGKVTTAIGASVDNANALAIQPDGKIVAAGTANITGSGNDFAVVRYTAAGGLDTTFDGDGIVTTAVGPAADLGNAVAVQADGKILVGGTALTMVAGGDQDPALLRYNADGSLDTTFGTGGKVQFAFPGTGQQVRALALYPYDRVVMAGTGGTSFFIGRVWLDTVATAGRVTVAGRVTDASGRGVQGVTLRLTGGDGETRTAITGSFGYYAFRDVEAGGTYTLSASARGRTIQDAVRLVRVNDELLGQDFRAELRAAAEPKRK